MKVQEQKLALYEFVINNPKLEELEAKINAFNPFSVLKISHHEIRHSNVLAWLLDPKGNHNLGDYFLKKFLLKVVLANEEKYSETISLADLMLKDFSSSIVTREEKNIDILVKSQEHKLILIIENKIKSDESENQLTKYYNEIMSSHRDWFKVPLYLTLDGNDPKHHDKFGSFSHVQLALLIKETLEIKNQYLLPRIKEFISYYLESLISNLDMDPQVKKICIDIYTQHQLAADTLFDYIKNHKEEELIAGIRLFLEENNISCIKENSSEVYFLPANLAELFDDESHNSKFHKPVGLYIKEEKNKLKICLEVLKFDNEKVRSQLIDEYNKATKRTKSGGSKSTTLFSETLELPNYRSEIIQSTLNEIYLKLQHRILEFETIAKNIHS